MLYSACKHRRMLGALRSQVERKQVYVRRRRRRKRLEGLKAAQIEALALSPKVRAIEVKRLPYGRAHLCEHI